MVYIVSDNHGKTHGRFSSQAKADEYVERCTDCFTPYFFVKAYKSNADIPEWIKADIARMQ